MITTFKDLYEKKFFANFSESKNICKKFPFHFGQPKLLYGTLMFLTKYSLPGDYFVYPGAAPGYGTGILAKYFPDVQFELWDPLKIEVSGPNIKTYRRLFDNEAAKHYGILQEQWNTTNNSSLIDENEVSNVFGGNDDDNDIIDGGRRSKNRSNNAITGKRIILICDIRNTDMEKAKRRKDWEWMDNIVENDMKFQLEWCRLIRPSIAMLKFRCPYYRDINYPKGILYLQPYNKPGNEMRLVLTDYDTEVTYPHKMIEGRMSALNIARCSKYSKRNTNDNYDFQLYDENDPEIIAWKEIIRKEKIVENWDNLFALNIIYEFLNSPRNTTVEDKSRQNACGIFKEIVDKLSRMMFDKDDSRYSAMFIKN